VLKQARASEERWNLGAPLSVLDGVPIAVKDMVHVTNHKLCYGSQSCIPASDNNEEDAMVANFRDLGAIILGVTVSTEGGVTPLGYSLWWDGPFNPFDVNYYPGGSSSGSGVAVAAGLAPIALGFDGGGSIRAPASMSGVIGLATTYGRIPTATALEITVVKAGPLTATVADAALAHVVMAKENVRESSTHFFSKLYDGGIRGVPPAHLDKYLKPSSGESTGANNDIKGMRMGIFWDHFTHSDPEVVDACLETVRYLESQGAILVNITIPHLREIHLSHGLKILSEIAVAWESVFDDKTGTLLPLEANTEITIVMGKQLTATEVLAAEKIRTFAMQYLQRDIFRDMQIDAIVSPTLGSKVPKPARGYRSTGESNTPLVYKVMRFMPLANFLGLPAMSIPVGYEKDTGLPIGFQLLGDAWMEHKLLRIAAVIESQFVKRRTPPKENYYDALAEWLN
jgi:Asp-tRNA(Asn)/Glu-tRNA(Gln) amidotransferase A subunit family amidase